MVEYITALRAVSALYARQIMKAFFITVGAIAVLLFAGTVYLIQEVSAWWWLMLIPIISFGLILAVLYAITRFIVQKLDPPQSPDQKEAVRQFVIKLNKAVETMQTPKFLVFIYLVRDAFTGNQHGFIQQATSHSMSLKNDFERLITLFRPLS